MGHAYQWLPTKNNFSSMEFRYNSRSITVKTNQVNIDGISSLIEWNQGRKLELNMYFGIMSAENLVTVKHLLKHHSTFHRVEIYYKNSDDNLDLSFDVLHQQWVCSVFKQFIFTLRNQEADQLKNEVSASSIDVILSGRVSQNPFIMESVLKNLECFDIQRLRKTSSGIRRCVDYIKPEPHIEKCSIEFDSINRIVTSIAQRNGLFKKVRSYSNRQTSKNSK
ncbi:hypothetical protein L3Y34_009042 [Caenorhabditis briggsae]|uniref:F-box domain-containing protein n=1 Tax=Caenorhabditis briggsae TaxID=6238 RepID=A0AAE9A7B3_CAEBR|nr:hypothetical protein L3Y34_009042 [Caenorhabditis briggsae]